MRLKMTNILCLFVCLGSVSSLNVLESSDESVLQHRLDTMDKRLARHDAVEAKIAQIDYKEAILIRFDQMEAKLARFGEMEAKLSLFDEMEAKLTRFDELEAKIARFGKLEAKLAQFDDMKAKLARFDEVDATLEQHEKMIARLARFGDSETYAAKYKELAAKIAMHQIRVSEHIRSESTMRNDANNLAKELSSLTKRVKTCEVFLATKENKEKSKVKQAEGAGLGTSHKRALSYEGDPIAFTAYLDHDLSGIGTHENLVFGHVLLNDGNGYNMHTGVFTVPVSGVYHFDFFIGERDVNQIYVWLTVNNTNKIDAVAESFHTTQDLQGGNAANLKLVKGDVVFIKHYIAGTHVEGSDVLRISSFSGFLLYPIDSEATIIG